MRYVFITHDGDFIASYCHFNSICYNSWGVAHEVEYDHKNRYSRITDISFTLFMVTIGTCSGNGDRRIFMLFYRNLKIENQVKYLTNQLHAYCITKYMLPEINVSIHSSIICAVGMTVHCRSLS